jgi:hypothetical protein
VPDAQPEGNGDEGHSPDGADDSSNYDTGTWTIITIVSIIAITVTVVPSGAGAGALGSGWRAG